MNKAEAHKRLNQAIEYLKDNGQARNQSDMAALMGVRQPHLASAIKGDERRLTEGLLHKFATAYSDYINEEWLLEGKGRMENVSRTMRPHYEATAAAGFMDGMAEGSMSAQFRQMVVGLREYDFTVRVKGESMLPRIEDGDTLMCHKVTDRLNPPIGKICVLDTKEGMVVKVIEEVKEDSIRVHSLNPDYHDYEIEHGNILGIAVVNGLVREF